MEIEFLNTILFVFCSLKTLLNNSGILFMPVATLPFFYKKFKIVVFVGMELKGNSTLVLKELMKSCSRIL